MLKARIAKNGKPSSKEPVEVSTVGCQDMF